MACSLNRFLIVTAIKCLERHIHISDKTFNAAPNAVECAPNYFQFCWFCTKNLRLNSLNKPDHNKNHRLLIWNRRMNLKKNRLLSLIIVDQMRLVNIYGIFFTLIALHSFCNNIFWQHMKSDTFESFHIS